MSTSIQTSLWIIATGVIVAFLYLGRAIMAPFAMAVFLYLIMEGFARAIDRRSELLKRGASRVIAILVVVGGFVAFIMMMVQGIAEFSGQSVEYEAKIDHLIADIYGLGGIRSQAPSLSDLLFGAQGQQVLGLLVGETSALAGELVIILIYVAFLFVAQSGWPKKFDKIWPDSEERAQVSAISHAGTRAIESYLWTQTVISALITVLTYVTLVALGVQNALFLAALIFVLNYIPTIGSIVAAFVPLVFALVQPDVPAWVPGEPPQDQYIYAGIVFGLVSFWQFSIGNFLQPRMMGDSLNLSALVVLLSLAIWGAIWGIPGMFLSAPLTVIMMILFAQSDTTRWIAILLSDNGQPDFGVQTSESVTEVGDSEVESQL